MELDARIIRQIVEKIKKNYAAVLVPRIVLVVRIKRNAAHQVQRCGVVKMENVENQKKNAQKMICALIIKPIVVQARMKAAVAQDYVIVLAARVERVAASLETANGVVNQNQYVEKAMENVIMEQNVQMELLIVILIIMNHAVVLLKRIACVAKEKKPAVRQDKINGVVKLQIQSAEKLKENVKLLKNVDSLILNAK